jgi:outer membrane protein assembly factor BamD
MKKFLYIFVIFTVLSSCSEYQSALRNEDISVKFKLGEQLYNEGKYAKANKLFVQIVPNYRGKPQAEKLMYLYSDSFYKMEDYHLASYQFDRFAKSYPKSEKVEDALFLSCKSLYMLSPAYTKEQGETIKAIEKLQVFINSYPESQYIVEANTLLKELDFKLEQKAFDIARQYNKIGDYTGDYEASIKAFDNFIFDFPGSSLREKALFYRLDSAYKLAINSTEFKKQRRLETAQTYYNSFKAKYANSEFIEETDRMISEIKDELNKYSTKS